MTNQQEILGAEQAKVDAARDRSLALDRTPIPVARQILDAVSYQSSRYRPRRILDVGCGEGSWGIAARDLWPDAHLTGIDLRGDALPHMQRNYDRAIQGSFPEDMAELGLGPFDMVVGNPPFSRVVPGTKTKENLFPSFVRASLRMMRPGSLLCFYALNDLGQRGLCTRQLFNGDLYLGLEACPPCLQLRVAGSIGHRGPKRDDVQGSGTGDSRCYSAWVWTANGEGGTAPRPSDGWTCIDLPALPVPDRRWTDVPGTEIIE